MVIAVNLQSLTRFPNPVNETSARLVATGVVAQAVVFLALRQWWVLVPLTYGFLARVATGPTLSPLGQFVTRIATPAVEERLRSRNPSFHSRQVPGPPKRFAQAIGLAFTAGCLDRVGVRCAGCCRGADRAVGVCRHARSSVRDLSRMHRLQRHLGMRGLRRHQRSTPPGARRSPRRGPRRCYDFVNWIRRVGRASGARRELTARRELARQHRSPAHLDTTQPFEDLGGAEVNGSRPPSGCAPATR